MRESKDRVRSALMTSEFKFPQERITVSLDALDTPTFLRLSGGRGEVSRVLEGIDAALAAGLGPVKVNCVVQRGVNEHAVVDLARHVLAPLAHVPVTMCSAFCPQQA